QIKVAQEMLYGPGNAPASGLDPEAPYHKMVEALGGYGEKVTSPEEIRPALQRAFDSGVPACVNVMVDANLMKRASYLGWGSAALPSAQPSPGLVGMPLHALALEPLDRPPDDR